MKQFLAFSVIAAFAFGASAQVYPLAQPDRNGIVFSMNPLPPVVSNNRIQFAPGAPFVDGNGMVQACGSPLVIDHASGHPHAVCAEATAARANDAAEFANLATAAGGPAKLTDRNLSSDGKIGLRTDRETLSQ